MSYNPQLKKLQNQRSATYKEFFDEPTQKYITAQLELMELLKREPTRGIYTRINGLLITIEANAPHIKAPDVKILMEKARVVLNLNREIAIIRREREGGKNFQFRNEDKPTQT